MTRITGSSTYLQTIDSLRRQQTAGAKSGTAEKSILDSISQESPDKADALEKKLDDTKQADAQLRNIRQSLGQSQKADAAEKVKRIKEQIKMLKMMGGDPKQVARQIAQLARELASAVKEYSGGRSLALDSPVSGNTGVSGAAEGSSSPSVVQGNAAAGTAGVATDASALSVSSGTVTPAGAVSTPEDTASTGTARGTQAENHGQDGDSARQKQNDALQEKIAEIRKNSSESTATREFIQEVRMLAAQLKALANQQKQRTHQNEEHAVDQGLNHMNQALAEVERNASNLTAAGTAPAISVSIFI